MPGTGLGRVGELAEPLTLEEFAARVAAGIPATAGGIRVAGDLGTAVRPVAVCGGVRRRPHRCGGRTGSRRPRDRRPAPPRRRRGRAAGGPALVDVAHWASEWPWLAPRGPAAGGRPARARRYGGGERLRHASPTPGPHAADRISRTCSASPPEGDLLNAEPDDQLRLLDVQALDSRLDQLAHRRRTLPELRDDRRRSSRASRPCATGWSPPRPRSPTRSASSDKAEADVEQVRSGPRATSSGWTPARVGSAKELETLQHEVASLARRQSDLEEVELEVMERLEDARAARQPSCARDRTSLQTRARRGHRQRARRRVRRHRRRADLSSRASATGWPPADPRGPDGAVRQAARRQRRRRRGPRCYQRRCEGCRLRADTRRHRSDPRRGRRTRSCAARSAAGSWCARPSPALLVTPSRLVVEADGGSRGNPGPAAYGALVRDADTGEVLVELAEHLGDRDQQRGRVPRADRRAARPRPSSTRTRDVEVRMDSKLVVEQMSGRWQVKHEAMRRLAKQARDLLPSGRVEYTWIPRARNKAADALVNESLDDVARGGTGRIARRVDAGAGVHLRSAPRRRQRCPRAPWRRRPRSSAGVRTSATRSCSPCFGTARPRRRWPGGSPAQEGRTTPSATSAGARPPRRLPRSSRAAAPTPSCARRCCVPARPRRSSPRRPGWHRSSWTACASARSGSGTG